LPPVPAAEQLPAVSDTTPAVVLSAFHQHRLNSLTDTGPLSYKQTYSVTAAAAAAARKAKERKAASAASKKPG